MRKKIERRVRIFYEKEKKLSEEEASCVTESLVLSKSNMQLAGGRGIDGKLTKRYREPGEDKSLRWAGRPCKDAKIKQTKQTNTKTKQTNKNLSKEMYLLSPGCI